MSNTTFRQISGLVAVLSAAALIVFNAVLWTGVIPRSWEYAGYVYLNILLVFSVFGLYAAHLERRSSVVLHIGFVLIVLSLIFTIGFDFYAAYAFPVLQAQFPDAVKAVLSGPIRGPMNASMFLGILGYLVFFGAAIAARVLPRWSSALIILSALTSILMLPYNISGVIGAVGLLGAGVSLMRGMQSRTAMQPQTAGL